MIFAQQTEVFRRQSISDAIRPGVPPFLESLKTRRCDDPEPAFAVLDDLFARQCIAVLDLERAHEQRKLHAIKTGQASARANPEISVARLQQSRNSVLRQPIFRRPLAKRISQLPV